MSGPDDPIKSLENQQPYFQSLDKIKHFVQSLESVSYKIHRPCVKIEGNAILSAPSLGHKYA